MAPRCGLVVPLPADAGPHAPWRQRAESHHAYVQPVLLVGTCSVTPKKEQVALRSRGAYVPFASALPAAWEPVRRSGAGARRDGAHCSLRADDRRSGHVRGTPPTGVRIRGDCLFAKCAPVRRVGPPKLDGGRRCWIVAVRSCFIDAALIRGRSDTGAAMTSRSAPEALPDIPRPLGRFAVESPRQPVGPPARACRSGRR
jgi:hypothetical protein